MYLEKGTGPRYKSNCIIRRYVFKKIYMQKASPLIHQHSFGNGLLKTLPQRPTFTCRTCMCDRNNDRKLKTIRARGDIDLLENPYDAIEIHTAFHVHE